MGQFAATINEALSEVDESVRMIAEPGRYYVTSAFSALNCVVGKKALMRAGEKHLVYYVSDGVYGTFIEELLGLRARLPLLVAEVS